MKTVVINLIGGSGIGKSTTAAGLFAEMKMRGLHCELVREYVKNWAWRGEKIGPFDQIYLLGKQARYESQLYGKVDYVITDSPLILCPIYEQFYGGTEIIKQSAFNFIKYAESVGVKHVNVLLTRRTPFDTRGRYEDIEEAKRVDAAVERFLMENRIEFITIDAEDRERVKEIIGELQHHGII